MKKNLNPLLILQEQLSRKTLLRILKDAGYKDAYKSLKGGWFRDGASEQEILSVIKNINRNRKIARIRALFQDTQPISIPETIRYTPEEADYLVDVIQKRHPRSFFKDVVATGYTGTKKHPKGLGPNVRTTYMKSPDGSHMVKVPDVIEDVSGLRKHGFEFGDNWKRIKPNEPYDPQLDLNNLRNKTI